MLLAASPMQDIYYCALKTWRHHCKMPKLAATSGQQANHVLVHNLK
jgi:hypothetical protein